MKISGESAIIKVVEGGSGMSDFRRATVAYGPPSTSVLSASVAFLFAEDRRTVTRGDQDYYERCVLGSLLLDPTRAPPVMEILQSRDFQYGENQIVFDAITDITERGETADIVAVAEEIRRNGVLDQSGGPKRLLLLLDCVFTARNAEYYALKIYEHSARAMEDETLIRLFGDDEEA